ncbi:MAG: M48 family metalloprotease [Myxococcaceae bacterium]|nr:M48 family metalloprotease [Myxococcaceae bacterium]
MRKTLVAVFLALAATVGAGCATASVRGAEKAVATALISTEEENQLGAQMHQELQKQGIRYSTDPVVTKYVEDIARPIIEQARRDRPDVKWHIFVVDTPEVNAFATAGGYLYVQTGLIRAVRNDAELAGVLAHEAGHVTARHVARALVQQYGLQAVAGLALGENPSQLQQLGAAVLANGAMLHHSRAQESEADEYGARYARAAGFDPNGLISFFNTLRQQSGDTPALLTWLSSHPATGDRIAHLQQYIAEHNLRGGAINRTNELTAAQQRLGGTTATGGSGK